jgi:hypothetical protein
LAVLVATIFVPLRRAIRMLALVIAFASYFARIFFQQSNAKSEDSADFLIG